MSETATITRRRILAALGSAPMLPLAASFSGFPLLAQANSRDDRRSITYDFGSMAAPSLGESGADGDNPRCLDADRVHGKEPRRDLCARLRDVLPDRREVPRTGGGTIVAGGYYDINNQPICRHHLARPAPVLLRLPGRHVADPAGRRAFAPRTTATAFSRSCSSSTPSRNAAGDVMYGQLPSPIAVLTLDQDRRTGPAEPRELSQRRHLGRERPVDHLRRQHVAVEHPSVERGIRAGRDTLAGNAQFKAFSTNLFGDPNAANPYDYGHLPEVTVHPDGTGTIKKHYCLGRISHELVQVMPDERTVLMGDDATNGGLFMFVADRPRDLSAGTLYVGQVDPDIRRRPRRWQDFLDQPRPRHQRRNQGHGRQRHQGGRHHGRQDQRSGRCELHQDPLQRQATTG